MSRKVASLTAATVSVAMAATLWGIHGAGAQTPQQPAQPTQPGRTTGRPAQPPTGTGNTGGKMSKMANMAKGQNALSAMDRNFVMTIGHGNAAEVQEGNLAQQKSASADVKQVSQTIVTDHGQAQTDLKAVGQRLNVTVPDAPTAAQKASYNNLSKMSGAAFDKKYIAGQIKDHDATLALIQKEIKSGSNADVKAYAQAILPKVQMHTNELKQIGSRLGVYKSSSTGKPMKTMSSAKTRSGGKM